MNANSMVITALLGLAIFLSGCTHPPVALFEADCDYDLNRCDFDASSSQETEAPIVSYEWRFYEGGHTEAHVVGGATGVTTSFVYHPDTEEAHANLTVTDDLGRTSYMRSRVI